MADLSPLLDQIAVEPYEVTSPDGTRLGCARVGHGPPLVVCHGSFAGASDWLPFARELADTRTVHLYDRRGRGASTDGPPDAAVDAEVDDLAAVMAQVGPDAALLGHSFGGGCALAYAARRRFPGPVVVYEPRHSIDRPVGRGRVAEIRRVLATSGRDVAVRAVLAATPSSSCQRPSSARKGGAVSVRRRLTT